jgi:hypothetical protein
MNNFVRDIGVIVVAVAAGLLFASSVQAQGQGSGFGNISIFKILQGSNNHNRHGKLVVHRRHNAY